MKLGEMTPGARHAITSLLVLSLLLAAGNLIFTARYVNANVSASQKAAVAAAAARATATDQAATCKAANESRAQQVSLWTFIIRLSKPPQTAAQRAALAAFERYLRVVFAPLPCTGENT